MPKDAAVPLDQLLKQVKDNPATTGAGLLATALALPEGLIAALHATHQDSVSA